MTAGSKRGFSEFLERKAVIRPAGRMPENQASQPISRVLSWTVIHLGPASLLGSSDLPGSSASHTNGSLFGLAPNGVCRATHCYQARGALLPHPFTLTFPVPKHTSWRSTLCCTFRGLSPPRRYLAFCSAEPGLSSTRGLCQRRNVSGSGSGSDCLANSASRVSEPACGFKLFVVILRGLGP